MAFHTSESQFGLYFAQFALKPSILPQPMQSVGSWKKDSFINVKHAFNKLNDAYFNVQNTHPIILRTFRTAVAI